MGSDAVVSNLAERFAAAARACDHPDYVAVVARMVRAAELFEKKNRDYGSRESPLQNVRRSEEAGVRAAQGAFVRCLDKVGRLSKFFREGNLANESAQDSVDDLAVYMPIVGVLLDGGNFTFPERRTRVYVAGPYTVSDPCVNTHEAIVAADLLLAKGYAPFVSHLSHFWHTVSPKPYGVWLDYDAQWIPVCDVLLRLPGESSGADEECAHAATLGIPVFEGLDALLAAVPARREA